MSRLHQRSPHKGKAATFHIHRTDGEGEWTLRAENGAATAESGHARGDVAMRGSAEGLYWVLMGRGKPEENGVEVHGDPALASSFKEWRDTFQLGWWTGAVPRPVRRRQFVVDRVEVIGWLGITPGGGGRPLILGLMARPEPRELLAAIVQQGLAYVAERHPGPVWCSLRQNDQEAIALLQREGFEVIASQLLMFKELALKVPARRRVPLGEKRLVPQYG